MLHFFAVFDVTYLKVDIFVLSLHQERLKIRRKIMTMQPFFICIAAMMMAVVGRAQDERLPESDPVIVHRIEQWQDLKFGFMMHWGMYAQWGVVESWSICNEPWITRNGEPYTEYKQRYQSLNKTFNPQHFDAQKYEFFHDFWPIYHFRLKLLQHVLVRS